MVSVQQILRLVKSEFNFNRAMFVKIWVLNSITKKSNVLLNMLLTLSFMNQTKTNQIIRHDQMNDKIELIGLDILILLLKTLYIFKLICTILVVQ